MEEVKKQEIEAAVIPHEILKKDETLAEKSASESPAIEPSPTPTIDHNTPVINAEPITFVGATVFSFVSDNEEAINNLLPIFARALREAKNGEDIESVTAIVKIQQQGKQNMPTSYQLLTKKKKKPDGSEDFTLIPL